MFHNANKPDTNGLFCCLIFINRRDHLRMATEADILQLVTLQVS